MASYRGLLLAPPEGFGIWPRQNNFFRCKQISILKTKSKKSFPQKSKDFLDYYYRKKKKKINPKFVKEKKISYPLYFAILITIFICEESSLHKQVQRPEIHNFFLRTNNIVFYIGFIT